MLTVTVTSSSSENVLISKGIFPDVTNSGVDVGSGAIFPKLGVEPIASAAVAVGTAGAGCGGPSSETD